MLPRVLEQLNFNHTGENDCKRAQVLWEKTFNNCLKKWNVPMCNPGNPLPDIYPGKLMSEQRLSSVQFSSVAQSCPTLCNPMNCSTPGLPVHHQLPEFTHTHVHPVSDAIQPSHPLSSPSPPAPNTSQHQSLFQGVNSSHEVAKVLEFQL